MRGLLAFFPYYGSKGGISRFYERPKHRQIIEPFAGSARYSLRYPNHQVKLYDVDPIIVGVWSYLIGASRKDVLRLPISKNFDEDALPQEAAWLIGFWLHHTAAPCTQPSAKPKEDARLPSVFWGEAVRKRIADQLLYIKHWQIEQRPYSEIETPEATWFVDPPYASKAGRSYRFNEIDYEHLGSWCRGLPGQTIVCEAAGASWLPFGPFRTARTSMGKSEEVVWYSSAEAMANA